MMTNSIKQYLQNYGVEIDPQEVIVQPLPAEFHQLGMPINSQSFHAAADYIINLQIDGHKELRFVLGYDLEDIPVERAIIRVGNSYYDPVRNNKRFVSVLELSANQLMDFVDNNDRPPTFGDWVRCCV